MSSPASTQELAQAGFTTLLMHLPGGVVVVEAPSGKLLMANDEAERIWRKKFSCVENIDAYCQSFKTLHDDGREYEVHEHPLVRSIVYGEFVKGEECSILRGDGTRGAVTVISAPIFDSNHRIIASVTVFSDITERKKEEALHHGERLVLETIAAGSPLKQVLTNIIHLIESQSDGMLCSIVLLDHDGVHVRHGAAPSLPEAYIRAIDGAPIGPCAGSCGTAMYRGEPVIVTDILQDPLWTDYRELAQSFHLRACWSTPILSHTGKVLGSFAMYYHEPRYPSVQEARLTRIATHVAGIAIERQQAEEALRRLAGRLITAQEEERRRISRELHDGVVQTVASLALGMSRVKKLPAVPDPVESELSTLQHRIAALADDLRQISHQLHPAVLEHAGLIAALRSFAAEFGRMEGIEVQLSAPDDPVAIPDDVALCAYRLVQESLRNASKHSGSKTAQVSLTIGDNALHVIVRDRGRGFDVEQARANGLGMVSLEERVRLCHGELDISSRIRRGTTVRARLPLGIA